MIEVKATGQGEGHFAQESVQLTRGRYPFSGKMCNIRLEMDLLHTFSPILG